MTPTTAPHNDEARKPSRARFFILGAVGAFVFLVVVVCVAIVAALNSLGDISIGSKHLEPIPVAPSACPYLREVHDKADAAGRAYLGVLTGQLDPHGWRTEAARHAQLLAAFELTLRAAKPHVPAPVANELQTVIVKVAAGRKEVKTAQSPSDYQSLSAGQVFEGTAALGNASDLVGNACGFVLSPNVTSP